MRPAQYINRKHFNCCNRVGSLASTDVSREIRRDFLKPITTPSKLYMHAEPNHSIGTGRISSRLSDKIMKCDMNLNVLQYKLCDSNIVHDQHKHITINRTHYVDTYIEFIERISKLCRAKNAKKIVSIKNGRGDIHKVHNGKWEGNVKQTGEYKQQTLKGLCTIRQGDDVKKREMTLSRNKVQLCIMGHEVEALVDTGATLSVISNTFIKSLESLTCHPIDLLDIDSCTLANGEQVRITHKTFITFTLCNTTVTAKFYILDQISIDIILGCDIFEQFGVIIDFKKNTMSMQSNENAIYKLTHDSISLGYLAESQDKIDTKAMVKLAPQTSLLLEPKSSNRVTLKASSGITNTDLLQGHITIREPISLQFKTDYFENEETTDIVTILRNDTCTPQWLLSEQCIMTLDQSHTINRPVLRTCKVDKVDLSGSDLNEEQICAVRSLLNRYNDVFAEDISEIGCTNLLLYDIRLKDNNTKPIRMRAYRTGYNQRQAIESQVDEWLRCGIIRPSMSEWAFPCLLVNKKGTDKQRLVVDFRALNSKCELPSHPLLDLEEFLADLGKEKCLYYTTIDLKSAYLQVPLSKRSQELCSFICSKGQFSFLRAPFGLCALPLVFARLIDEVLRGIKHEFTQAFLDDILVYSCSFDLHLKHIQIVLERLRKAGLTVEPTKTAIARKKVVFIGYTFSKNGVTTDPSNIDKVKNFPIPKKIRDVRSFIGLSNFYKKFVKNYALIARPLNNLLKKSDKFIWTEQAQQAFDELKRHLISSPILAFPDLTSEEPLYLTCDASLFGSGHVLSQKQPDVVSGKLLERVIAYGGRNFTETQQRYTVTERELLAVVFAVEKLDQYLRCKKFIIVTDHSSLQWLLSRTLSNINARLARWVLALNQYNFTVIYKPGTTITNADSLSRQQFNNAKEDISFVTEPYINALRSGNERSNKEDPPEAFVSEMAFPGLEKFSIENVSKAQQNDCWYGAMLKYIINDELPSSKQLSRKIVNSHQNYMVINNMLYHIWSKDQSSEEIQQLCITNDFKELIWTAMHVVPNAGHMGITKTYAKLRNAYFWPKMAAETSNYVKSCDLCAQVNRNQRSRVPLQSLSVPSAPLESLHIDILRIATCSKGANYILMIICAFSKYIIAKPMKRKTCRSVAKTFFQHYVLVFGLPIQLTLTSDNGMEFKGQFQKALLHVLGINSIYICPYTPNSNGMIERSNRSLISILSKYAMHEPHKWAHYLPFAVLAMNSAISESSDASPFELIHGIPMKQAIDIQIPPPVKFVTKDQRAAHKYWSTQLMKIRSLARDQLYKAKTKQKKYYDKSAKDHNLKLADVVYLERPTIDATEDPKLHAKFVGPCIIQRFLSPTNVILKDVMTNKRLPRSYHINKLKKVSVRKRQLLENSEVPLGKENLPVRLSSPEGDEGLDVQSTVVHDVTTPQMDTELRVTNCEKETAHSDEVMAPERNNTDYVMDNAPTESYIEELVEEKKVTDPLYPVKKIHRKRITSSGDIEFYVSWTGRPKKYNCWLPESNLTEPLRKRANALHLPISNSPKV